MNDQLTITINADTKAVTAAEKQLGVLEKSVLSVKKAVTDSSGSWTKYSSVITACSTSFMAVKTAVEQFVIAPLAGAVNSFIQLGDTISKTSQRVGMSIETLGGLKFAAEQCGANFDILTAGIQKFQNTLGAAQMGDSGTVGKLGKIGLNVEDFAGLSNEDQLMKIADHIKAIGDRSEQTRVAMELFGKAGFKLLPFFQEGSEGIKKLIAEGKDIGAVMGEEATQEAVAMADAMNRMKSSAAGVSNTLISMLAPAVIAVFDGLTSCTKVVAKFLKNWGDLVGLFTGAVALFLSWPSIIAGITAAFAGLTAGVHALTAAVAMNPIGAMAIAAAAAGIGLVALVRYMTSTTQEEKRLTESTKAVNAALEEMGKTIDAGKKKMEEMDAAGEKLKETVSALQELNEKESLNSQEKQKQADLIDELNRKYPQLGIEIDKNTGKIKNFNAEMAKAIQAQAAQQTREIYAEQGQLDKTREKLRAEKQKIKDEIEKIEHGGGNANVVGAARDFRDDEMTLGEKLKSAQASGDQRLVQLVTDYIRANKGLNEANARNKELEAKKEEIEENSRQARMGINRQTLDANQSQINNFNRKQAWEAASPEERKRMEIEHEYEAQAAALDASIASLTALRNDEVVMDKVWEFQHQLDDLQKQRKELDLWKESSLQKVDEEAVAALPEETEEDRIYLPSKDERIQKAETQLQTALEQQAQALRDNDGVLQADAAVANAKDYLARTVMEVSGEARAAAKGKLEKAEERLANAQRKLDEGEEWYSNEYMNALTQNVKDAQEAYDRENNAYLNAAGLLRKDQPQTAEEAVQDAVQATLSSSGTFSAYGLDAAVTSDIPKQTLEILKKLLDNTDEIKKEQKNDAVYTEE